MFVTHNQCIFDNSFPQVIISPTSNIDLYCSKISVLSFKTQIYTISALQKHILSSFFKLSSKLHLIMIFDDKNTFGYSIRDIEHNWYSLYYYENIWWNFILKVHGSYKYIKWINRYTKSFFMMFFRNIYNLHAKQL